MKKFLTALCLSLTAAATAAAFAACDGDGQEQAHTHDMTYVTAVEATCTEEGNTAYYKCDGCGKYYSDQEGKNEITLSSTVVAAKGHTPETVPGKEATCTQAGLTEGKKCSVCGAVIEAQEEIAAKGHTPATAVNEDEVAATCTSEGSYDEVVYCSVCDAEISREHKTVGKTAHDLEPVAAVPATCTANGTIAYYKCKDCGAMFSDEAGETAVTAEDIVDPAKGHTPETIPGKEATCKETGLTQGEKCSVCGEILTAQIVIPVKAHTPETVPGKAATCTEDGLTDGEKCSVCGTVLKEGQKIPALKHDYTDVTPEWKWEGYESATATFVCTRENCGNAEDVTATVESKVTVEATCEKEGEKTYTATVTFGDKQYTDTKAEKLTKADHTPATAVKENEVAATCTSEGSYDEVVYCSACGAEISREQKTVGKTAHKLEIIAGNSATCTEDGTLEYYKCKDCGAMFSDADGKTAITAEDIVEPAKGHTYASVSVTTAPTAEAEGSASVTCANCDYSGEIALPAITDENVENGTYLLLSQTFKIGNATVSRIQYIRVNNYTYDIGSLPEPLSFEVETASYVSGTIHNFANAESFNGTMRNCTKDYASVTAGVGLKADTEWFKLTLTDTTIPTVEVSIISMNGTVVELYLNSDSPEVLFKCDTSVDEPALMIFHSASAATVKYTIAKAEVPTVTVDTPATFSVVAAVDARAGEGGAPSSILVGADVPEGYYTLTITGTTQLGKENRFYITVGGEQYETITLVNIDPVKFRGQAGGGVANVYLKPGDVIDISNVNQAAYTDILLTIIPE